MAEHTSHIPRCTIGPPARCCYRDQARVGGFCAAIARWKRPGSVWFADAFFCAAHRLPGDVEIAGERVFRRVRLSLDVLLSAVDASAPIAQAEAIEQLERAIKAVYGEVDVLRVSSSFVRWQAPERPGRAPAAAGDPE